MDGNLYHVPDDYRRNEGHGTLLARYFGLLRCHRPFADFSVRKISSQLFLSTAALRGEVAFETYFNAMLAISWYESLNYDSINKSFPLDPRHQFPTLSSKDPK